MTNTLHEARDIYQPRGAIHPTGTRLKKPSTASSFKRKKNEGRQHLKGTQAPHDGPAGPQAIPGVTPTDDAHHDGGLDEITALISQLHESVEQGRIFDARNVVRELEKLEISSQAQCSGNKGYIDRHKFQTSLHPVRHLIQEVLAQSNHVESLLHDLHSNDNWTLAKQSKGVTVHYRREENSPIHLVRAQATFTNFEPKDFVRLCSLFVETELMPKWFPGGVMKKANVLSWHSKYSKVIQLHISLGLLPMTSPRDAVVYGNGYHLPDRNAFLISSKSIIDEDSCRYCTIPNPDKGVVRMTTESIFYMELVQRNVISFKLIGKDDLKFRFMPSALLNFIAQGHMPFDLTRSIRHRILNFEGSIWEEKIRERGQYYKEIEDKVYEQLQAWDREGKRGAVVRFAADVKDGKDFLEDDMQSTMDEDDHLLLKDKTDEKTSKMNSTAVAVTVAAVSAMVYYFLGDKLQMPVTAHLLGRLGASSSWKQAGITALLPLFIAAAIKTTNYQSKLQRNNAHSNARGKEKSPRNLGTYDVDPQSKLLSPQSPLRPNTLFSVEDYDPSPPPSSSTPRPGSPNESLSSQKSSSVKKMGSFISFPRGISVRRAVSAKSFRSLRRPVVKRNDTS